MRSRNPTLIVSVEKPDLQAVNDVIRQAIQSWPTTTRLKRLAMAPLQYREADLRDFEFLLCYKAHACVGVAAWQPDTPLVNRQNLSSKNASGGGNVTKATLLHGLFVNAREQGCGIGGLLLDELTCRARLAGFAGIYVRAERFSTTFFEQKGFHRLADGEALGFQPVNYPHRYWIDANRREEEGSLADTTQAH